MHVFIVVSAVKSVACKLFVATVRPVVRGRAFSRIGVFAFPTISVITIIVDANPSIIVCAAITLPVRQ